MEKKILASQGLRIAHLATPVVPLSKTAQRGASMYMESTVKKYERLLKYFIFQTGAGEDSPVGHFTARSSRRVFHKELGLRGSRTQVCNDSASRVPLTEVISPPRYARPEPLLCRCTRARWWHAARLIRFSFAIVVSLAQSSEFTLRSSLVSRIL